MPTAAEFCGQLGGIDLVAAADADLRQPWTGFLEEDGQLLAADRVELIDGTVRLISRRPAVAQPGLADGSPDEPVTELEVQPLQDAALHPEGGGRPALEETPGHHHGVGAELDQLSRRAQRVAGGVVMPEATSVGQDGDVEARRRARRNMDLPRLEQVIDQLAG